MSQTKLTRALPVTILGVIMVLAPIGNLFESVRLTLEVFGVPWPESDLDLWWKYLQIFEWHFYVLNLLIFLAGVFCFIPRKMAWIFTVSVLVGTSLYNIFSILRTTKAFEASLWVSIGGCIAGVVILSYFRYPYIDRRDRWLKVARRFNKRHKVLEGHSKITGFTLNLSRSGALIQWEKPLSLTIGQELDLTLGDTLQLRGKVIRMSVLEPNAIGVKFVDLSHERKGLLKKLLRST